MATHKVDYQKLSTELDIILAELQAGDLDVDKAVKLYERGNTIIQLLQAYLLEAENKVNKIQVSPES